MRFILKIVQKQVEHSISLADQTFLFLLLVEKQKKCAAHLELHTEKCIAPFVATQIFCRPIGNAKRRMHFYRSKKTFPIG